MFELLFCSLITILPDYLLRRRFQGKRLGHEITFFTVWYELRVGITLCLILTVSLITIVFYYHPSTSSVSSFFRTVTILPERGGRVSEVFVENSQLVAAGDPIFQLDTSSQEAAAETARRQIAEVDAALKLAEADQASARAALDQASAAYQQTLDELERQQTLLDRGSSAVALRDIERLENRLAADQGQIDAAEAGLTAAETNISVSLPARRDTAEAALAQAEAEIEKLTVYAGIDGEVQQLTLRAGDIVNPMLRPAGILVPKGAGSSVFEAGFPQIAAQVVQPGGVAELLCLSKPFTIIPMVITDVQDVIAAGQVRPSDRLLEPQNQPAAGSILAFLEPVYTGQTDDILPGSRCIANAYTSNHDRLENPDLGFGERIYLHVVDTVGVVHAAGLRLRAILMPFQVLVFSGH